MWSEDPPNKVLDTKFDAYTTRGICHREDGLILYLPNTNSSKRDTPIFEVVLHRPAKDASHQAFRYVMIYNILFIYTK